MTRKQALLTLRSFVIVVASVAVTSIGINAISPSSSQGSNYIVVAGVEPARYIVVDSNLQIKQVISNTAQDVVPYVAINSVDGSQIPYTSAVRNQFLSLKPSLDFSKAGVVYSRDTSNGVMGATKNMLKNVRRFLLG